MVWQSLISIMVYSVILVTIGLIAARGTRKHKDIAGDQSAFLIGDRSLNYWVTALSAHASDMSSWIFMGLPGLLYAQGLVTIWVMVGLTLGMFLNWHYVAPALRRETEKFRSNTLASFFEKRFKDVSGTLRLVTAFMMILFFIMYIAAELLSIGKIFEFAFNLPYIFGIIGGLSVMLIYMYVGGFVSIAFIDFFQGIFLLLTIVIVPTYVYAHLSGINQIIVGAHMRGISLSLLPEISFSAICNALFTALGWGLGYFGMPHILNKFMSLKDPSEMYKAKYLGIAWQILLFIAVLAVGLVGIAYFPNGIDNRELIFIYLVQDFFAPFFGGLILCGILAGVISTIDSQILVIASIITDDFYRRWVNCEASSAVLLQVFRISIICVAIFSGLVAIYLTGSVYELVWYAWTGLGCSFGPLVLLSLFSKSVNKYGAFVGILFGGLFAAFWKPFESFFFTREIIPAMIPGFFGGILLILLVSMFTEKNYRYEK